MTSDFTALTAAEVQAELAAVSADVRATFGPLDDRQFNWRASDDTWSVGQCLDHLVKMNRAMCVAMSDALDGTGRRTVVQRLPLLPGLFGRMLVKSQSPVAMRKFTAPPTGRPGTSAIDRRIVDEFVNYNSEMAARLQALGTRDLTHAIMVSPFASFIAYSLLDAWRLIAAHNWRHVEQARRVTRTTGFPV
jgi:hypothetical protein